MSTAKKVKYLYVVVNCDDQIINTYVSLKSAKAEISLGYRLFRKTLVNPMEQIDAPVVRGFLGGRP